MSEITNFEDKPPVSEETREKFAKALQAYARRLSFENRSRRNFYRIAGLSPRRRDKIFDFLIWLTVAWLFVIPFTASAIYLLAIASPQYESTTQFVVRSAAPLLTGDRFSTSNAEPKQKIVQDTQVVVNYLASAAVVEDLQAQLDVKKLYARSDIDFFSRLKNNATKEDLLKYWKKRHSSWISPKSGIVNLTVRAFSPKEAKTVLDTLLKLGEQRINELNEGIWSSLEKSAQNDAQIASEKLREARVKVLAQRKRSGVLDVKSSIESVAGLISGLEAELAALNVKRTALISSLGPNAIAVRELNQRHKAIGEEIERWKERETLDEGSTATSLAEISKQFAQLNLDLELAERRFKETMEEFEKTKLLKSLQLVYLDTFTTPTLPEDSEYPNVPLWLFLCFLGFSIWCGITVGLIVLARQHFD